MIVINFFKLEHLVGELTPDHVIRIEGTVRTVSTNTAGISRDIAAVHVRAIYYSAILAFMVPVGSMQRLHGEPFGPDSHADELNQRLRTAERAIAEHLTEQGFTVRPGLIDIGEAKPVEGVWVGLAEALDGEGEHA
jgi:hypothetical protein